VILWGDFVKEKGDSPLFWPQRHLAGGLDESSPYNREKSSLSPFSFVLTSQPA